MKKLDCSEISVFIVLGILAFGFESAFAQSVAGNIRPVGQLCVAGQTCVGSQAGASGELIAEKVNDTLIESQSDVDSVETTSLASSSGETYEIQMRNQGSDGVMVFEPSVLSVRVGDSVTFKATDAGHNLSLIHI